MLFLITLGNDQFELTSIDDDDDDDDDDDGDDGIYL